MVASVDYRIMFSIFILFFFFLYAHRTSCAHHSLTAPVDYSRYFVLPTALRGCIMYHESSGCDAKPTVYMATTIRIAVNWTFDIHLSMSLQRNIHCQITNNNSIKHFARTPHTQNKRSSKSNRRTNDTFRPSVQSTHRELNKLYFCSGFMVFIVYVIARLKKWQRKKFGRAHTENLIGMRRTPTQYACEMKRISQQAKK